MITLREARELETDGTASLDKKWRHGKHREPEITGAKLSGPRAAEQRPIVPITRGEADAVAGAHMLDGGSRTMRLDEQRKLLRVQRIEQEQRRIAQPEDFTERALAKMAFYPAATYDPRNPATVGPRPDLVALGKFVELGQ